MNPEDRLRDVLRNEASAVVPAGDGLAKIQQRLVRRRRRRVMLVPSAALVMAAAIGAFFVLGGSGGTQRLVQTPGGHRPSPSFCYPPLAEGPCSTVRPSQPIAEPDGTTLWPFTSAAEAQAWQPTGPYPWAGDILATAEHFATDYLGITGLRGFQPNAVDGTVGLQSGQPDRRKISAVKLVHYESADGKRVWTVESVATDMSVTSPTAGAAISSPTSVTGRITGVDENVRLRLLTSAGKEIANGGAPAGSEVPWQGTLTWSDTSWTTAGIVGTTYSPKDGALTRLVVVPVLRATGATASGASFAGLAGGHVNLYDAVNGMQVRQLTFPPPGAADTGAAWNGSTLLWVRSQQTGCADELDRLDSGSAATLVPKSNAHLGTPRLSPDGTTYAYFSTPCNGDPATIVIQAGGSPARAITLRENSTAVADVRDDGTVLVNEIGGGDYRYIVVVPTTASSVGQGITLAIPPSCTTIGGAFDGNTPITWESCHDGVRVARFSETGARIGAGPLLPTKAYADDVTVSHGVVLAWLYDGAQLGRIVRVRGSDFAVIVTNAGCTATPEPQRCVRSPDW